MSIISRLLGFLLLALPLVWLLQTSLKRIPLQIELDVVFERGEALEVHGSWEEARGPRLQYDCLTATGPVVLRYALSPETSWFRVDPPPGTTELPVRSIRLKHLLELHRWDGARGFRGWEPRRDIHRFEPGPDGLHVVAAGEDPHFSHIDLQATIRAGLARERRVAFGGGARLPEFGQRLGACRPARARPASRLCARRAARSCGIPRRAPSSNAVRNVLASIEYHFPQTVKISTPGTSTRSSFLRRNYPTRSRTTVGNRALSQFALVSILALVGCSKGSTPEELTSRRIDVMRELGMVLAQVTDKDSAAAQEPRVSQIVDEMNSLRRHFTWLTDGEKRAVQRSADERTAEFQAALDQMRYEITRIRSSTDLQPVLGSLLDRL